MTMIALAELRDFASRALQRAGASETMAMMTAAALVDAEAQGLSSHGIARVPQYATHLRNGRADGRAPSGRGDLSGRAAVAQDQFAAPEHWLGIGEGEGDQPPTRSGGRPFSGT